MKYIVAVALASVGYAAFNPAVREFFMSQPDWAFVTEGIIAYVACGFPAFVHSASKYVRQGSQEKPDSEDMENGLFAWMFWPAYSVCAGVEYVWKTLISPSSTSMGSRLASAAAAYGRKRRKSVDKKS